MAPTFELLLVGVGVGVNEDVEEDPEKTVGFGEVPVAGAVEEVDAERPAIVEPGPISGPSKDVDMR